MVLQGLKAFSHWANPIGGNGNWAGRLELLASVLTGSGWFIFVLQGLHTRPIAPVKGENRNWAGRLESLPLVLSHWQLEKSQWIVPDKGGSRILVRGAWQSFDQKGGPELKIA